MPLKRVTLSGRLAQYEGDKPESVLLLLVKGCFAMAIDVAVALGAALFTYKVFMASLAPTYARGFYCYEVK